jgi:hypothetical protein
MPKSKYSFGLEGKRFNRTVIQSFSHSSKTKHEIRYYWNCTCDCGKRHVADARSMFRGMVQSCGCYGDEKLRLRAKHGATSRNHESREYTSWKKLKARIDNPKNEWFHIYGGRGIRYCYGFKEFPHFLKIAGPRPENKTIDRIDNNAHYSCGSCSECLANNWPLNVRWATIDEQNGNKRNTVYLTLNGVRQPLFIWAKQVGLTRHRLYSEYRKSESHALTLLRSIHSAADCPA